MKVIIALVILYLANFATSYYLHKKYVASQKRVRQYGGVSTARVKGSLRKKGKIVLLAFNEEDDTITYGEKFEGITVFSKFEKIEGIEGLTARMRMKVGADIRSFIFYSIKTVLPFMLNRTFPPISINSRKSLIVL